MDYNEEDNLVDSDEEKEEDIDSLLEDTNLLDDDNDEYDPDDKYH